MYNNFSNSFTKQAHDMWPIIILTLCQDKSICKINWKCTMSLLTELVEISVLLESRQKCGPIIVDSMLCQDEEPYYHRVR